MEFDIVLSILTYFTHLRVLPLLTLNKYCRFCDNYKENAWYDPPPSLVKMGDGFKIRVKSVLGRVRKHCFWRVACVMRAVCVIVLERGNLGSDEKLHNTV